MSKKWVSSDHWRFEFSEISFINEKNIRGISVRRHEWKGMHPWTSCSSLPPARQWNLLLRIRLLNARDALFTEVTPASVISVSLRKSAGSTAQPLDWECVALRDQTSQVNAGRPYRPAMHTKPFVHGPLFPSLWASAPAGRIARNAFQTALRCWRRLPPSVTVDHRKWQHPG